MTQYLDHELVQLAEAVAPPLVDLELLDALVAEDDRTDADAGDCTAHDGCRPVFDRRLL